MKLQGRRLPDASKHDLPRGIQPGDYWKVVPEGYWHIAVPLGRGDEAYALGNLINHTVREHEDGTISVRPGDGVLQRDQVARAREDELERPRRVRLEGFNDALGEEPLGSRPLHDVADHAHDDLGAAHAEGQGEALVLSAAVSRPDELRT